MALKGEPTGFKGDWEQALFVSLPNKATIEEPCKKYRTEPDESVMRVLVTPTEPFDGGTVANPTTLGVLHFAHLTKRGTTQSRPLLLLRPPEMFRG
jgi:hypothetical protein